MKSVKHSEPAIDCVVDPFKPTEYEIGAPANRLHRSRLIGCRG
jgi:hypothetical protein